MAPWCSGVEYGNGVADKVAALPRLGLNGYQASLGYVLNSSIQITAGWQQLDYSRSSGTFFNAAPRIRMDAGFLHLNLCDTDSLSQRADRGDAGKAATATPRCCASTPPRANSGIATWRAISRARAGVSGDAPSVALGGEDRRQQHRIGGSGAATWRAGNGPRR